jgi:predicted dithiol-disulfide oxidoreductase (DUF899 family)
MNMPPVVSPQEWKAAREELLVKEKEVTRADGRAERRRMARMAVAKDYRFEDPHGRVSLLDLFEGRRQLIATATSSSPAWPAGPRAAAAAARSWPTRSPSSPI